MTPDEKRLLVTFEARMTKYERDLERTKRATSKNFRAMRKEAETSASRIDKAMSGALSNVGAMLKGGLIGALTVGGVAQITRTFAGYARSVAEVGDQAETAAMKVKDFQELKYVAEQNRIGVDALTDGLKEMNLRADEFITSKGKSGSAAEAFKRLGYDADTLAIKLKNPSALFAEIIGRLQQLDKAAQIRIADEIFGGTGGEQFVRLIGQGEQGIRDTIQAANDLGVVMDEDLIRKAEDLDEQFQTVATTVGTTLKKAIVEAANALVLFINAFREFENRSNASLEFKQAELAHERSSLEDQILETKNNPRMTDQQRRRTLNNLNRQLNEKNKQDEEITRILNDRLKPKDDDSDTTYLESFEVVTNGDGGSGGGGGSRRSSSIDREREGVERLIQALKDEYDALGMTEEQKRIVHNLRRAGETATARERDQIAQLTSAIHTEEEAQARAAEQAAFFRDTAYDGFMALVPAINTGNAALDSLINSLIQATAQAALLGKGPLAGLFGGTSGGGLLGFLGGSRQLGIANATAAAGAMTGLYDKGGYTGDGGKLEPAGIVHRGEFVMTKEATRRLGVRNLEAMQSNALRGYASGGFVSASSLPRPPSARMAANQNETPAQSITINAPITVEGSAGTPEQNRDLAAQMARQMETNVRGLVASELRKQSRPGNYLNSRTR
ncbi:hypothetical protein K7H91_12235 [Martelella mediterranea]|uniref:hypothetical protein n=1 Tax=Martelella mediterranea TaxID=293089 RepID=UPI001E541E45|nr:hypothetical protein [Martelella mediterranea]MCD1634541.1 hypothetical protein [Martelella mediterranea]